MGCGASTPRATDLSFNYNAARQAGSAQWAAVLRSGSVSEAMMSPDQLSGCQALIYAGADVNARDSNGSTPLMFASAQGDTAFARLLLERGADPNARTKAEETPLWFAAAKCHTEVINLLCQHGADLNAKTTLGVTPLAYACACDHTEVVSLTNQDYIVAMLA